MIRKHKNDFAGKENIPTFAPVEPAKPLRNAQIGGSFFIYMETVAFTKTYLNPAQHIAQQPPVFTSWILVLSGLRNLCCHHSRVWNKLLPIRPAEPRRVFHPWIDPAKTNSQRIYFRCAMIAYLLCTIEPGNNFKAELKVLFAEYPNIDLQAMGFPFDWEKEPIWR